MPSSDPRRFLLKTLFAADGQTLTTRELVGAAEVLGITSNSLRVALVRLTSAGLVSAQARGVYGLGPEAAVLADDAQRWRVGEKRVRRWAGEWIVVHTGALPRSNRAAINQRERALERLGLREFARGLYARPDNLVGGIAGVRSRLRQLGLDDSASVLLARDFDAAEEERLRKLWDGRALTRSYERTHEQLERLMERSESLDIEAAAREFYRAGDKAIRMLIFDPLLPEPLVDVAARAAFTDTVLRFDTQGHRIWRELGRQHLPELVAPTARARRH